MRWLRYTLDGSTRWGQLEGDQIAPGDGDPFAGWTAAAGKIPLSSVKIEVPVVPRTFYCAGKNYAGHIAAVSAAGVYSADVPAEPYVAYRATSALIALDEPILVPQDSRELQYEGELAVVIGSRARRVAEGDALRHVLGYTIYNDVTERGWQRRDITNWRAKNSDTFSPLGPWIVTDPNWSTMETIVRVDGVETGRFRTAEMIFGVAQFIAAISRHVTLHPGDVISMGADGDSPNLRPGQVVEVEITGVGILRNPLAAGTD